MSKLISIGGYIAATVLIVLGLAFVVIGFVGRTYVADQLAAEKIVGSDDMNPEDTAAAVEETGISGIDIPTCTVAGEEVDTGKEAKCFADYMRVHTLEGTAGKTYSEMPRFATDDGAGTNDAAEATKGPDGEPMSNGARNIWVTETALATALYTSYFAENVAMFAIIVGIALLLIGIGFLILTIYSRRNAGSTNATDAPAPPTETTTTQTA